MGSHAYENQWINMMFAGFSAMQTLLNSVNQQD